MLYICATPIGNLEDITLRVLRVLQEVDVIFAEDTRHTRKLLNHFEIDTKVISMHSHNEQGRSEQIIRLLHEGKTAALVSDAGTPGISDPGGVLITKLIEQGIPFTVLPGPSATLTALLHSGFLEGPFAFYGFLPRKNQERLAILQRVSQLAMPVIFYESPHRIIAAIEAIDQVIPDWELVICRELTKKFEEIRRGTTKEHLQYFQQNAPRGEFVLVLKGYVESEDSLSDQEICDALAKLINLGVSKKDAVKQVAQDYDVPKNQVYQLALELKSY